MGFQFQPFAMNLRSSKIIGIMIRGEITFIIEPKIKQNI